MPAPVSTKPVTFCIPDHPDWRASLYGAIALMGSWLAWQRDDERTGKDVAEVWRGIIQKAQLVAERGEAPECMDWCLLITECIASDGSTREALKGAFLDFLAEDPEVQKAIKDLGGTVGSPMPAADRSRGLFRCTDPDVIFSQSRALVDALKSAIDDFFQIWEAGTNLNERAQLLIAAIPVVSEGFGDDFLAYLDKLQEDIVESIEAHYTTTGEGNYRDTLTCEIFCRANEECEININVILNIFTERLGAAIAPNTAIPAFAAYFLGGTFTGEFICDFAFMNIIYLMCVLNPYAGVRYGLGWFDSTLKMAANSPDPDWEFITECEDCSPETGCEDANFSYDFRSGQHSWVDTYPAIPGFVAAYHSGEGWGIGSWGAAIEIERAMPGTVTKVRVYFNQAITGSLYVRKLRANGYDIIATPSSSGSEAGLLWYEFGPIGYTGGVAFTLLETDPAMRLVKACVWSAS